MHFTFCLVTHVPCDSPFSFRVVRCCSQVPFPRRGIETQAVMKFLMEFAENLILRLMESPKERDRKFREHLYEMQDKCKKAKENHSYPLRPYGFWTFDRHNAQLFWDPQISQAPGRRDPYDDLLQHAYDTSTSASK